MPVSVKEGLRCLTGKRDRVCECMTTVTFSYEVLSGEDSLHGEKKKRKLRVTFPSYKSFQGISDLKISHLRLTYNKRNKQKEAL